MYENKIVHHNRSFKLFVLHNSFDNQGSKINQDNIFLCSSIQSECGKIPTRITPNTDTFYAVINNFRMIIIIMKYIT